MNRTIKFRGRDLAGKMRFGHYAITGGRPYIIEEHVWCEVYPDSVVQLVGYDADGREVYEGDTLVDADGNKHVARLESVTQNPDTAEFHLWTCPSKLKLTEAQS